MNNKVTEIIDDLKSLSLLEASELVKEVERTFGVSSATGQNNGTSVPSRGDLPNLDEREEQTKFSVILEEVPSAKKIAILKTVRSITGLGLKEAKDLVESFPKAVKEGVAKEVSEKIRKQLEEAGAIVSIK